jgi:lipopolysaccharide/colanic/teichoic acid biosynthesis glycosyltransferase
MRTKTIPGPVETRVTPLPAPRRDTHPSLLRPGAYQLIKRSFEVLLAVLLCFPALPLILLAAVLVKLTSRGPVFYSQVRLGLHGRPFRIWKIRSMVVDSEANGPCWSRPGDPRITKVGRFLRKTHLDELPQLWNVLRGDMSLVGPRPIRPIFFERLAGELPAYWQRLVVRPGLTGFAQVRREYETSMAEKLAHDLEWIADRSVPLYLRTLATTAWRVIRQSARSLVRPSD